MTDDEIKRKIDDVETFTGCALYFLVTWLTVVTLFLAILYQHFHAWPFNKRYPSETTRPAVWYYDPSGVEGQ
jgi:hypothetical protein